MRKELYGKICQMLCRLVEFEDGSRGVYMPSACGSEADASGTVAGTVELPAGAVRLIKHVDLWNHNVEFLEQEEGWERPAVFVEFCPIRWEALVPGMHYRAEPTVNLHVVTDWTGGMSADSELGEENLKVFDLLDDIHAALTCMNGETFLRFDLVESYTNHNHEDLLENIETYRCVAVKEVERN